MKVRIIPAADRAQYEQQIGESWFCDYSSPAAPSPIDCGGLAEIEIVISKYALNTERDRSLALCRKCAGALGDSISSAIESVDGAELAGWRRS